MVHTINNLKQLEQILEEKGFNPYWDFENNEEDNEFWVNDKVAQWIDENTNRRSSEFERMQ